MYTTPVEQISDGNGDPIVGAKKFLFHTGGGATKKTIYSDSDLTIARANPVLSDADGRFPQFFLDGLYDEEQQDNTGTATGYDGATLWGPLPVGEVTEGALTLWAIDNTYNIPEIVLGSDDNYYRSLTDSNTGNDPVSSPGSWEQLQWGRVWNTNVTYAKNESVYGNDGFLYISTQNTNIGNSPPISTGHWRPATNQNQSAIAAGAVDAITATLPIPLQALNDEQMVTIRASGANTITNPTFSPDGLTAKTITKNGNQALVIGDIFGVGHELQLKYNLANDKWELLNPSRISYTELPSGSVIQVIETIDDATATTTARIPIDATIPQNTEGYEQLTVSITPKFTDSTLYIEYFGNLSNQTGTQVAAALFKDSDADAMSAVYDHSNVAPWMRVLPLTSSMVSGSTSEITFKIRVASAAGTLEINSYNSIDLFSTAMQSRIKITEVR
jgi:hypothetical protein